MSIMADKLRKLSHLGLNAKQMAGVLEILADDIDKEEKRKEKDRERKRKERELSTDIPRTFHGHSEETPVTFQGKPTDIPVTSVDMSTDIPGPFPDGFPHPSLTLSKPPLKGGQKADKATRFALTELPPEWADFCHKERQELNPKLIFAVFVDHWKSKPGKDGTKLDWTATWRNWVRSQKALPEQKKTYDNSNRMVL